MHLILPTALAAVVPLGVLRPATATICLVLLAALGGLGAFAGGTPLFKASARVVVLGALAMLFMSFVGSEWIATVSSASARASSMLEFVAERSAKPLAVLPDRGEGSAR